MKKEEYPKPETTDLSKELSLEELRKQQQPRYKPFTPVSDNPEHIKKFQEYSEKVFIVTKDMGVENLKRKFDFQNERNVRNYNQIMPYADALELFHYIADSILQNEKCKYDITVDNDKVVGNLVKYFINDSTSEFDLNKGVLLYGSIGSGKSLLMIIFQKLLNLINEEAKYIIIPTSTIQSKGFEKYGNGNYCFDDLGDEEKVAKDFGNIVRPMDFILTSRYRLFQNVGLRTYATTNYPMSNLIDIYGDRIESRFNQMFNVIKLVGKDYRKQPNKK